MMPAFSKSVMSSDTKLVILAVCKSGKSGLLTIFGVLMSAHLGVQSVDFSSVLIRVISDSFSYRIGVVGFSLVF